VDESQATARDAAGRATGARARLRVPFRRQATAPVLADRVRAELGRVSNHAGALAVEARDGVVTLSGPVLRAEVAQIREAVRRVRGVEQVEDRLAVYEHAQDIPALQGSNGSTQRPRPEYLQEVWSPSARLVALLGGAGSAVWGGRRGGAVGWGAAGAGSAVVARATTNRPLADVTGLGAGRGVVTVTKTIDINAPTEELYAMWNRPSSFPQFMTNVREVREGQDGRTHWKVRGPFGFTIRFDAQVTEREANQLIAWATYPGAALQHAGRVSFEPTSEDTTRVSVRLSYNPVLGILGHGVAKILGRDPKHQLDQDLLRLKTFAETGQRPHDAAAPMDAASIALWGFGQP
jgi:uncharacterized membrane protein